MLINGESDRQQHPSGSLHNPNLGGQLLERRSSADFFNGIDDGSEDEGGGGGDDDEGGGSEEVGGGSIGNGGGGGNVDWKRRAMVLKRKLGEKEEELRALKRRVLEAVM